MIKQTLLLASKSPRRQQLLKDLHVNFKTVDIECEEVYPNDMNRYDVPVFLSIEKSNTYLKDISSDEILITADTVVICNERILEKPSDYNQAKEYLNLLANNTNEVVTGVTLRSQSKSISFHVTTEVNFGVLNENEIDFYINTFKPFDKAGAYGIQEWIGMIGVSSISGSYYNVVGLPVHEIYQKILSNF